MRARWHDAVTAGGAMDMYYWHMLREDLDDEPADLYYGSSFLNTIFFSSRRVQL